MAVAAPTAPVWAPLAAGAAASLATGWSLDGYGGHVDSAGRRAIASVRDVAADAAGAMARRVGVGSARLPW